MGAITIIWVLLKVIGPIYCAKEAERKNRSSVLWGIFGFLFPLITMTCIALVPPVTRWEEEN